MRAIDRFATRDPIRHGHFKIADRYCRRWMMPAVKREPKEDWGQERWR